MVLDPSSLLGCPAARWLGRIEIEKGGREGKKKAEGPHLLGWVYPWVHCPELRLFLWQ